MVSLSTAASSPSPSERMWRSGSIVSDDGGGGGASMSLGGSEDGDGVSSVAGSVAGSVAESEDGGGSVRSSGSRARTRGGVRSRGGRSGGRGSRGGKTGRGGRGGGISKKSRKTAEGGGKGGKPRAHEGFGLVGKTIKLHRDDVDYPNGRWCVADVQQWSRSQKKYLLSYRGRGSAWLPPGWLELKEKRKAQVVTVAPAEVGAIWRGRNLVMIVTP